MAFYCYLYCVLLAFLSFSMQAHTIILSAPEDCVALEQVVSQSFRLSALTYNSDLFFSEQEFHYLADLPVGQEVTKNALCDAITCLFQKKLFQKITITIIDDDVGKIIHIDLVGAWTFQKLKISRIWVNRDWYKQYYLMDPGDVFDQDKHYHSVKKIKEACNKEGFFNTRIKSSFSYDEKTKSVKVSMAILRGSRFVIRDVSLFIQDESDIPSDEIKMIEQQLYKKFIRTIRNGRYSKKFIERQARAIKQYLVHKGFLQSAITLTENICRDNCCVNLVWQIDLRKKRTFIFFGNRLFSHNQLLDRILQFGRSAWIVPASILAQELKSAYNAKGFWDVSLDARDEGDRSFFVIKEGKQAIIDKIEIQNAHKISQRALLKRCYSSIKRRSFFDRDLMNAAFDNLIDLYLSEGFLDAKILAHEFIVLSPNHYTLAITIDEGARIVIDDVSIPDYPELEIQGPFFSIKNSKQPMPYDVAMIQEQKRWLTDYFHKRGYLLVCVKSEIKTCDDKTLLTWIINPGKKVRFGKTIIQGCDVFPFCRVMRELQYKEGLLWDQEKIRRSFLRLKDLQLFDAVSFTPLALPDVSTRPVLVKLHKEDPFEIRIRSGFELQHIRQYQTFTGLAYKVGGTFIVKNPLHRGDQFRFDIDVARSHREMVIKYRYPWLFDLPLNGLFQVYGIKYEQPGFIGSKNDLYTIFQTGFLMGLRHKVRYFDGGSNLGFEWAETKLNEDESACAIQLARAINFDVSLLGKRIPFVFIEPTLMIDLLDNNLNPTYGMFSLISLKGMFPTQAAYTNAYFVKLLIEHSWFLPIKSAVAAFRVRFGHIFHRDFSEIMPNERFYLGGAHSIRSYITDLAPPLGCFINAEGKRRVVPRGGKTMINVNVELRSPLFKNAGFVVFQDLGALSCDRFADFKADHIVAGTGFGVRYLTPIGPLRFDIAWKWSKCVPGEHSYNWFLTFGQAF